MLKIWLFCKYCRRFEKYTQHCFFFSEGGNSQFFLMRKKTILPLALIVRKITLLISLVQSYGIKQNISVFNTDDWFVPGWYWFSNSRFMTDVGDTGRQFSIVAYCLKLTIWQLIYLVVLPVNQSSLHSKENSKHIFPKSQ